MNNKKTLGGITAALSLAALTTLTACGESEVVENNAAAAEAEGATEYPLTIENCGRDVVIDAAPQRAVALDQGATEIMLSLGLEDRMVGTASWTDPILESLSEANDNVPRLSDNAPTYEVLIDADPDFVAASFGRHYAEEGGVATQDRLDETGIASYLSPTDCGAGNVSINAGGKRGEVLTPDVIYQEIEQIAEIFDVPTRGEELIDELKSRAAAATEDVDLNGKTVAFWFADTKTPYVAGGTSEPGMISELTGMENVFSDLEDDWPGVGWETFVDKDPEILVLGDLERDRFPGDRLADKEEFLSTDPLTRDLDAVKNQCYITLHGAEMNPSIRFVDALEKIQTWSRESDSCAGA